MCKLVHVSVTSISNPLFFRVCTCQCARWCFSTLRSTRHSCHIKTLYLHTCWISALVVLKFTWSLTGWQNSTLLQMSSERLSNKAQPWQGDILEIGGLHPTVLMFVWVCVCDRVLGVRQPEALRGVEGDGPLSYPKLSVMAASSSINKGWCIHPNCSLSPSLSLSLSVDWKSSHSVAGPHTRRLSF